MIYGIVNEWAVAFSTGIYPINFFWQVRAAKVGDNYSQTGETAYPWRRSCWRSIQVSDKFYVHWMRSDVTAIKLS